MNNTSSQSNIQPFLKWAGGKRWLVSKHSEIFPLQFNKYIEPFLGSGAVFFHLQPDEAILSDVNADLIETYQAIKDDWRSVWKMLQEYQLKHSKEFYYKIRSQNFRSPHKRAAKFIYLNRTCWNGLYRVNLKGEFNVPIGTKDKVVMDSDDFEAVSKLLSNIQLKRCDFEQSIAQAEEGDLVFVDPPYTVKHNFNGFIKYNESLFSWEDQERLKEAVMAASERGANVIVTNADHESIRTLYEDNNEILPLNRASVISGKSSGRGKYGELAIQLLKRDI